jgi:hypothetical protein
MAELPRFSNRRPNRPRQMGGKDGLPFRTLATLTMTRRRRRFCAGLLTLHTNIQFAAWQPAGIGLGHRREVSNSDQLLLRN